MLNLRLTAVAAAALMLSACAATREPVPLPGSDSPTSIEGGAGGGYVATEPTAAPAGSMSSSASSMSSASLMGGQNFPVNAKPGECYARVVSPPKFEARSEKMLAKAESERIEIIPAKYSVVEEKVLVKPAGKKIVEIIPAVYKTVEETQLIKPATTAWKKGHGPIEKYDGLTGEIMCLVTVPAEYRTIRKSVVASPAEVKRVPIPAEYGTVRKMELLKPAEAREVETPAEYKIVRTQKVVSPAQEKRIPIPAQYQTVASKVLVSEGKAEWKSILCETNTTPGIVQNIQRALLAKGFNPGKIDGIIGRETVGAINGFQQANGLATGGLTMETLEKLGVSNG